MEEEFQYTNRFLRDNKDFIISLFYRNPWEKDEDWSNEQQNAAAFCCYVLSVLNAVNIVCGLIGNSRYSRTDAEALLSNQLGTFLSQSFAEITDETDKFQLLPTVIKFITPKVMDEYAKASMAKMASRYGISFNKVNPFRILKDNKISIIEYESPYKYFVNYVFMAWAANKESQSLNFENSEKLFIYRTEFDNTSWFSRLENLPSYDYSEEKVADILYGIINDNTKIKDEECKDILFCYLSMFSFVLKTFREMDKDFVETDNRENLFGLILPKEQTKEERRIEVAADYLVEHHYISDNYKDLFVNIMNNRCPSGKIKFSHGVVNGKSKKKGGVNVLYGIIRFIREENFNPDVKEGKRQYIPNHSNDCWHFIFPGDSDDKTKEEMWYYIKDSGRRNSRSLSSLIKGLNSKL